MKEDHDFPEMLWHTKSIDETLAILNSNPEQGLSSQEAKTRLHKYGHNEIIETGGRSSWDILLDQFKNVMLLMLIAVAIISGILDLMDIQSGVKEGIPFKDTIAILAIVILNGILGYFQESKAEKALAALKKLSSPLVKVLRNGQFKEVEAKFIVPGDIITIEAGSQLAIDGQLLEAVNLQICEAALTGEAHSVTKSTQNLNLSKDTPLGDRLNMVFTGTEVIQGRGKIVVTNTGMTTELGKIASMLQNVESEPTPLQQRMTQLGNILVSGSLILVAIVVLFGSLQVGNFSRIRELLEVSLSMAVAVVPEGLPAVITVTLALGTQRMVKRNALIRKLPAVETLGSVNTICSDKTGTLTQNKMVVQEVTTGNNIFQVTGEGYVPEGKFILSPLTPPLPRGEKQPIQISEFQDLNILLMGAVLCNDAILDRDDRGEWKIIGDPTEGALLSLAGKANLFQDELNNDWVRMGEFPFSSERKRMSVICENTSYIVDHFSAFYFSENREKSQSNGYGKYYLLFSKGSPELILQRCNYLQQGNENITLTEAQRGKILTDNENMASRGLRVLGLGYKLLHEIPNSTEEDTTESEMTWLGLVGMLDAPRSEVKLAVEKCVSAGIRPVMITGDHPLTAMAIAQKLGIARDTDSMLTGVELEKLSQPELEKLVNQVSIYARVSPEHKLRIVQALQKCGKFVAMTGDGVNDAPALKQADIGIAMGITGTDVSKEASDMILLDDNFTTIVAATEEGRVVYSNIRRFIKYILGSNIGEVLTIAAAPLLGLPEVPLTPLQILWMNLVTDGLPALALAVEPAEPDVMRQPPFSPQESIFARGLGSYMIRIGIIFAVITISLMLWSYNEGVNSPNPNSWKTMVFTTLCIAQMGHAIAVRSHQRLAITMNPLSNPALLIAVVGTTILQLMLIYVPPLRTFFDTELLTFKQLLICLGFSSLMFIWVELEKIVINLYRKQTSRYSSTKKS